MTITLSSTDTFQDVQGIRCRIWDGETDRGVRVIALIPYLGVNCGDDESQFRAELEGPFENIL